MNARLQLCRKELLRDSKQIKGPPHERQSLKTNDGSILRSDLDGKHVTTIIPPGGTFTPKQIQIDKVNRKLYWSDREGMRVMRANLDGSSIETLVDTSEGDARPSPDAR